MPERTPIEWLCEVFEHSQGKCLCSIVFREFSNRSEASSYSGVDSDAESSLGNAQNFQFELLKLE